jgi:AcrR family transcriptional regulator
MAGGSTHGRSIFSADTRARLIDAARVLFHSDGYDAVTVRAIASTTGMTTGALYAHFDSKAEVLFAVVKADAASGVFTRSSARSATARREAEALLLTVASLSRQDARAREVVAEVLRGVASSGMRRVGTSPPASAVWTAAAGVLIRAAGLDT